MNKVDSIVNYVCLNNYFKGVNCILNNIILLKGLNMPCHDHVHAVRPSPKCTTQI